MWATLVGGLVGAVTFTLIANARHSRVRTAVCTITSATVSGSVEMRAIGDLTEFACHLTGFPRPGLHGCHIHAKGDLREGCNSTCSHYNPTTSEHGDRTGRHRHRGDLGNLVADDNGACYDVFVANVPLHEIVGRTFLIHEDEDDLGRGGTPESRKTGSAGARLACGIIGRLD